LYEIKAEKVKQEIGAPPDGTMIEIFAHVGDTVKMGGRACAVDL